MCVNICKDLRGKKGGVQGGQWRGSKGGGGGGVRGQRGGSNGGLMSPLKRD